MGSKRSDDRRGAAPASRRPAVTAGTTPLTLSLLAAAALLCWSAEPLSGQWPGEVRGRVVDRSTGRPVDGADVVAPRRHLRATTDARGVFRLRGLEPGRLRLRVTGLGYAEAVTAVQVQNGVVARPLIELAPRALEIRGVRAEGRPSADASISVVEREELARLGARTAADVVESLPGVTVRSRGAGGPRTVSVRGSDPDEVLVLLDGAPLNDPVTGAADLSTIPTESLQRVTVVRGASSARFGSRAQAGAVVLESRAARIPTRLELRGGSLERTGGAVASSGTVADAALGATVSGERLDGGFDFQRPEEVGGRRDHRKNAGLARVGLQGSLDTWAWGGELAARIGGEALERGIPGKSFAPSDSAEQELLRGRTSVRWRGPGPLGTLSASGHLTLQSVLFRDPAPPLGTPFSDRTELARGGARLEVEGTPGPAWMAPVAAGLRTDHLRVRSDVLEDSEGLDRTDASAWIRTGAGWDGGAGSPRLSGAVRLHRDGTGASWRATHDVTLSLGAGGFQGHVSHRSAFSPPTLGDQFFREGVGVEPNPGLRAERVPSEVEVGAGWSGSVAPLEVDAGLTAYRGDVKDMILWAPDFRFVWSPRNVDVKRRGLESWLDVRWPVAGLRLGGSFSRARVVYDRPGPDSVQVRYRPRHTASIRGGWSGDRLRLGVRARYLGTRYPVPAPVNALSPFWSVDVDAERAWRWSGWTLRASLAVDRLLDRTDAFLFGFPEPGRTWELALEVRPPGR